MRVLYSLVRLALDPPLHRAAEVAERGAERAERQNEKINREADAFANLVHGMREQGMRPKKRSSTTRRK